MRPASMAILVCFLLTTLAPVDLHAQLNEKDQFYSKSGKLVLGGTINGSLEIGPGNYVVTDDIFITPSASLKIYPGTRLWFENRMRMEIAGSLTAVGDSSNPITFAALPSKSYYRNPYSRDSLWEGIVVTGKGAATLFSTTISDARYGIRAPEGCEKVILGDVILSNIKETPVVFPDYSGKGQLDKPINLMFPPTSNGSVSLSSNQVLGKKIRPVRKISFFLLGAGVAGFTTAAICEAFIGKKNTENGISHLQDGQQSLQPESRNGIPMVHYNSWREAYRKSNDNYTRMDIFSIASAACAVGLVFTIPSSHKGEVKK